MSTTFDCVIDTSPMAQTLSSVTGRVERTTQAVVTMQAAVVAAEKTGADKVCANVNRGFYSLVLSQISQKIANKQSRVEALGMKLAHQKRMLLNVKRNMEREYQRISERYLRLFTVINRELEHRIKQVDQPVFDLVNRSLDSTSNRMMTLSAWSSTMQAESVTQSQEVLLSTMKHHARTAIEQSADFLSQISEQRVLTQKTVYHNPQGNDTQNRLLPALVSETINDAAGHFSVDVATPRFLPDDVARSVRFSVIGSDQLRWGGALPPQVQQEFLQLLQQAQVAPRVKQNIHRMFTAANTQTI